MKTNDTIIAPATGSGGSIAIIRMSGPAAFLVAGSLHDKFKDAQSNPRSLILGQVKAGDELIDHGLAVAFPAPHSYSGEDMVEFQLHASPAAVRQVLEEGVVRGARLAEPGEFTKRAYLNGKLDLVQAEAVADTIAADTDAALKLASDQVAGALSKKVAAIRQDLVAMIAELSAQLDFGDEDIADTDNSAVAERLKGISLAIGAILDGSKSAAIARNGISVAVIGLPNAGKSSLLNALAGHDRAIVSDIPGTTRDTVEERIVVGGVAVHIIDTAGLRESHDAIEAIGVERSHQAAAAADVVLVLASSDQAVQQLKAALPDTKDVPMIAVQTKSDLSDAPIKWPFKAIATAVTSAVTGDGLDDLRKKIAKAAGLSSQHEIIGVASARQLEALRQAHHHVDLAQAAAANQITFDVIAGELTIAAEALGGLLGEGVSEEVIAAIFSKFCIGK